MYILNAIKKFKFLGLLCACVIGIVVMPNKAALGALASCDDCYKCVLWDSTFGCLKCEYDEAYCGSEACTGNQVWDPVLEKCVCDPYPMCMEGQIVNEETCECEGEPGGEVAFCEDGFYSANGECLPCPVVDNFTVINSVYPCGGPHIAEDMLDSILGCFYGGGGSCTYDDNSGTFIFTDNCFYSE